MCEPVDEMLRMFSFLIGKLGGLMRLTSFERFSGISDKGGEWFTMILIVLWLGTVHDDNEQLKKSKEHHQAT